MKTIVLGDTHGRSVWKLITHKEKPDRVIFIGDYFDSFDFSGVEQIHNFKEIIEYKEKGECEVVMLIGNHDHHYFPEIGNTGTSGYQTTLAPSINQVIDENRHHLIMAYQMQEFVFTHAGVSSKFMDNVFGKGGWKTETIVDQLNEMFKYKPKTFEFAMAVNPDQWYIDPTGDNQEQSPIWIRPRSLMRANYDTLRKQIVQVVGHTEIKKIDVEGHGTGNRYWFIDTLGTSGQYMIIEDGEIRFNEI
jgi:predicted phosphodiesterase